MYGVFFEKINNAGEGGLYIELVQNSSFEDKEFPQATDGESQLLKVVVSENIAEPTPPPLHDAPDPVIIPHITDYDGDSS